jgi:hypothetical protein
MVALGGPEIGDGVDEATKGMQDGSELGVLTARQTTQSDDQDGGSSQLSGVAALLGAAGVRQPSCPVEGLGRLGEGA